MYSIEALSKNLAKNLREQLNYDDEKTSVIEYGLYAFFQIGISILLVAIVGAIFNVMLEALIISFVISIFRKYSGGAHASTAFNCAIIGVLISVIPAIIFTKIYININYLILVGALVYLTSIIITYKLAPVDSPNKPIKSPAKIKRLKKGSIILLTIYMFLSLGMIFIYLENSNLNYLIYSICIYSGVSWQVLTLTKLGHAVVSIIDFLLIKIFKSEGGV
ncbi:accessory regulator AgrB [Clostridium tertium]|uniref:Putative accessory gene regulator protein n=1 Tax=Clostridium tertium TaxID=1559 RepID=A0A6N3DHB6_9CLOT